MEFTDLKLAERWRDTAAKDLRYCAELDTWALWTGSRWRPDVTLQRMQVAKALTVTLEDEIEEIADDKARKKAWGHYTRRLSVTALRNLLAALSTEPGIATRADDWDADPLALMTPSGVVELATGRLRPATPADLHLRSTAYAPDGRVPPSRWLQFLDEITEGSAEMVEYLRRAVGMTLVGERRDQVLLLCSGIGSNGKSLLIETLVHILGDYACLAMPNLLSARANEAHTTELMMLKGRRLVYCDEVKDNRLDESKVKRLTGGRQITARGMNQDPKTFAVEFTIWADCNDKPTISGTDDGIWRRIQLVPFRAQFMGDNRDPELDRKLIAEAPGILAWAISAARDYLRHGLAPSETVTEATKDYKHDQDVLADFLELCCIVSPAQSVSSAALYDAVKVYFDSIGWRPWGKRRVTQEVLRRGFAQTYKGSGGERRLRGLSLKGDWRTVIGMPAAGAYGLH